MKTYVKPGKHISFTASGSSYASGVGVLLGAALFGVALGDVADGEDGEIVTEGVVEIAKLSTDNMALGAKVNWNDTNGEVQLATSDLDGVGTVVEAAGASTTMVKIKLTPV